MDTTYRGDLRELNELNFARFDAKLEQRVAELRGEIVRQGADFQQRLADQRAELIKWMFIFWAGTIVPLAGLILTLHKP